MGAPPARSPITSRTSPHSPRSTLRSSRCTFSGGIWPTVWIVARIAYLPLYLFGVVYARSTAWAIALLAIVMMLVRLTWG